MNENVKAYPSPDALWSWRRDSAVGVVVASAAGDALGSQYEFGPALADDHPLEFDVSRFGHAPGEWTDDTSMAVPILQALARGDSLNDSDTLARIVTEWREWSLSAKDVGVQTSAVLRSLPANCTEEQARAAAKAVHERTGRSGGNGSLMRTGPVALGYLGDGEEGALADAAGRLAQLTHWEDDNVDACVLWSLAIRHAVRTAEFDVARGLVWVPAERRDRWAGLIEEALRPSARPVDFAEKNGWVVRAFQCALSAVVRASSDPTLGESSVTQAVSLAIRAGGDTDTVAAIAGSLAGAVWGGTQVPTAW
ncbi:MAG TPA: ADP-ribosylglycohydrolase family protein, partial [Terrimesophilobacter sp.]|nr:ADP-ribosylglycohydrolase family protein [Terrimesophilobacter sp.]